MAQLGQNIAPRGAGPAGGLATEHPAKKTVKIEFYNGAKVVVAFYIPTENGIIEERVAANQWPWTPEWLEKIIEYAYRHGTRREVRKYNPVARREYIWQLYVFEIPAEELLQLIKSAKTGKRARRLVELLESLIKT